MSFFLLLLIYIGLNCLRCQQNQEFTECLTNDQLVSANQHQQHENERTGTVQPSNNQIGVEDLRQRRIHHFSTSPSDFTENGKALIIKIHRIKIKEDFIKGFILNKVRMLVKFDFQPLWKNEPDL